MPDKSDPLGFVQGGVIRRRTATAGGADTPDNRRFGVVEFVARRVGANIGETAAIYTGLLPIPVIFQSGRAAGIKLQLFILTVTTPERPRFQQLAILDPDIARGLDLIDEARRAFDPLNVLNQIGEEASERLIGDLSFYLPTSRLGGLMLMPAFYGRDP